jgi:plastocyanin
MSTSIIRTGTLSLVVALVACGGGDKSSPATPTPAATTAGATWSTTPLTPKANGKVVVIETMTDESGNNQFSPKDVTVSAGDVLRFTLKMGVHGVHFVADSNPAGNGGFPTDPSDLLQLPGQTVEVMAATPGRYYFQCDPHALLGMTGHVTVK